METITLELPESQIIEWVRRLSPGGKRSALKALIPELDEWEAMVDYGEQRMRELCAARGLDWDRLSEEERERLVDELLHEA
jgi:hypothetical protein